MLVKYKAELAQKLSPLFPEDWTPDFIAGLFERPKQKNFGHMALPVFRLAGVLKKAPPILAQEFAEKIRALNLDELKSVEPASGFLNFSWKSEFVSKVLVEFLSEDQLGLSDVGKGKKLIIDYSSPNVAKPMHVGHLRATVIGQAICNLARTQGFEVIGLNHLGDWGVQFGKLAWAYKKWGSEYDFESEAFESLFALYVRFHKEIKEHPEYETQGARAFKALEDGDPELRELWEKFISISMEQYKKSWARLGVKHDLVKGESFYSDRLDAVVTELKEKKLLVESDGAYVVELDDKRPPCLITKSDGASLYATRDLASALYRMEDLKCDVNLYVTGQEQKLHFSQVFSVLEKMNYPWHKDCHHIAFGVYRFKNVGKMSSREGQIIRLEDILNRTVDTVLERIQSKNSDLENKKKVAETVGVGAVIFNDLLNDRVKDVEFDWEKVTDFEGDSGPYVQYSTVRCKSLIKKAKDEMSLPQDYEFEVQEVLNEPAEVNLAVLLLNYPNVLALSYKHFKPNYLASYLLDVAKSFSSFYSKCPVMTAETQDLKCTRLHLVQAAHRVLMEGLGVLNIGAPSSM